VTNLPVPVPRTATVSEVETGAYANSVRDALNFLINIPICTQFQSVTQTLTTSGTNYAVTCDSTAVDTYGGHSNSTNSSRYTAQVAGWYLCAGAVCFNGGGGGTYRKCQIYKNAVVVAYAAAQVALVSGAFATTVPVAPTIVFLAVGDYVEIYATCDSAGLTITPNTANESYLTAVWVHS
jgi:hypothetical protein